MNLTSSPKKFDSFSQFSHLLSSAKKHRTDMTDGIQGFIEKVSQMPGDTKHLVEKYIGQMLEQCVSSDGRKNGEVTFSYPQRGGQNDGNPALKAILELLPRKKLVVSENPYTRAKAIWYCEDFKVTFNQKQTKEVLTKANALLN